MLTAVQSCRLCAARLSRSHAGLWAYGTRVGWFGATVIGFVSAGLGLAVGQALMTLARPIWAGLLIALTFVAPEGMAGF